MFVDALNSPEAINIEDNADEKNKKQWWHTANKTI
jgi:hypothetical protein